MTVTTIKDCLIISCSQRKRDPRTFPHVRNEIAAAPMAPAWNVYDGNQIRIVRKHHPYRDLDVLILSARFGLLTPRSVIPLYNDKLDWARARSPTWVETHVTEAWAWITGGEVGTYRAVYTSLNTIYETALASGLREFGIEPRRVLCDGPTSRGRRLKALSAFCRERHDPYGIAILDEAQIPVVVARHQAGPPAGVTHDQGPNR
jgi:hypothetical protein